MRPWRGYIASANHEARWEALGREGCPVGQLVGCATAICTGWRAARMRYGVHRVESEGPGGYRGANRQMVSTDWISVHDRESCSPAILCKKGSTHVRSASADYGASSELI